MAKALSLNEIRRRAAQFVVDWRNEPGDERQQAQSFIRDLLRVFGITSTKAALYEKRAKRSSTGHRGYIDALVPGLCAIEMKSAGKDLEAAERQALDYIGDLTEVESPRWVIASDFTQFRVLDLQAPDGADTRTFTLEELPANSDLLAFLAGYQTSSFGSQQQEEASVKAAQIMADLYEALSESGYDDHDASVFLVRVLFCLYADDAGVWGERDQFYEFLEQRTSEDGSDLGPQLAMLFQAMNRETTKRQRNLDESIARFPYVNGGIFAESASIPSFDSSMRELLLQACAFNWSAISPAIFGSLFQAVKDAQSRRELGEHYTTETNILKTIQPLFLDELRARFAENLHDVAKLKRLRSDLGQLRVMDPACGCGNFLVVAYRELRALDLQILERLQALGDTSWRSPTAFFLKEDLPVTLDHFAGIEIEEWPARIASTALHLVDHQANQAMELALGQAPDPLPLGKIESIHVANALRADWSQIVAPSEMLYIVGNPPFVGYDQRTASQKADLMHVWDTKSIGRLDYVTSWYKRSLELFAKVGYDGEFAFVSTNSITQGEPVSMLFEATYSAGWQIKFAHRTFLWTSEASDAAKVHCTIIGFRRRGGRFANFRLFEYESVGGGAAERRVRQINPYLLDAPDVIVRKRTTPLSATLPKVKNGNVAGDTRKGEASNGGLVMSAQEALELRASDPVAARYLRPFVGGEDFLNGKLRYCLWLQEADPADIFSSVDLRRRLANVKNVRERSTEPSTVKLARTPHLFKHVAQPETNYVCIPRTVPDSRRYLAVGYLGPDHIVSNGSFWAEDPEGVVFAIASSSMFIAWQRAIGGRIKSDPRFANTLTWNTFPFQVGSHRELEEISSAGKKVLEARSAHPERSLAEHYNPLAMAPALLKAHDALDRVVDRAFGARKALHAEEERQEVLFKRYAEMTGA